VHCQKGEKKHQFILVLPYVEYFGLVGYNTRWNWNRRWTFGAAWGDKAHFDLLRTPHGHRGWLETGNAKASNLWIIHNLNNKQAFQHWYYYYYCYYQYSNMKHVVMCSRKRNVFPWQYVPCTLFKGWCTKHVQRWHWMWGVMTTHETHVLIRIWDRYSVLFCKHLALLSIHITPSIMMII
jgi:hypothetical protein